MVNVKIKTTHLLDLFAPLPLPDTFVDVDEG